MNFCKKCHKPATNEGLCNDCKRKEEQLQSAKIQAKKVLTTLEHGEYHNYLVYQGKTFAEEIFHRVIWAPISPAIHSIHHWDRLKDLKIGDRIFHCVNGEIVAISIVKSQAQLAQAPTMESPLPPPAGPPLGYSVRCKYTRYYKPLELTYYRDKTKELGQYKYSPFDKDGLGNQGYLFPLCNELADFFDKEIHKFNCTKGLINCLDNFHLKDISSFEFYNRSWDDIIFKIINTGDIDCFTVQYYFKDFNYVYEWEVFLDALAYYGYVDFKYPNLTTTYSDKYAIRKVIITKEEFAEIIKNRNNTCTEKISYDMVLAKLNYNLVGFIKQMLPLVNYDGTSLLQEQEDLIYNHIARDMVYATESDTHITIEDLEAYCAEHSLQPNSSYCCKLYEMDDLEEFDTSLSKSMLVFGRYKNSEFYYDILNKIMDDEKHCVEVLSLSSSPDIKNNYQIIVIYPSL